MFSTSQEQFIKSFVPTLREKGYKYYVCYTHTRTNNDYNGRVEPDLYIVASKEKITASSAYSYAVPSGSVRYIVRTPNYSTNNSAVNTERIVSEDFTGNLRVDVYEHVYTNSTFTGQSLQPDILGGEQYAETSYLQANNIILAVLLFVVVIWNMWSVRK